MVIHSTLNAAQGYLRGQLLIAAPSLADGSFDRTVVYLCEHDENGAMGIVVNRPVANIRLGEIVSALSAQVGHELHDLAIYFGGPVESHRGFVLHSDDFVLPESVVGECGIALTSHVDMLKAMAEGRGPRRSFLALGYAGWGAGQLEQELAAGAWISAPATPALVFEAENDMKWSLAAASLGVDIHRLSGTVGHA